MNKFKVFSIRYVSSLREKDLRCHEKIIVCIISELIVSCHVIQ